MSGGRSISRLLLRHANPDMKAKHEQLISIGKCKKLAITAVMRKPIVMAKPWQMR